jgi:hypothetical protein
LLALDATASGTLRLDDVRVISRDAVLADRPDAPSRRAFRPGFLVLQSARSRWAWRDDR